MKRIGSLKVCGNGWFVAGTLSWTSSIARGAFHIFISFCRRKAHVSVRLPVCTRFLACPDCTIHSKFGRTVWRFCKRLYWCTVDIYHLMLTAVTVRIRAEISNRVDGTPAACSALSWVQILSWRPDVSDWTFYGFPQYHQEDAGMIHWSRFR
jgi:hypothetical protein